MLTVTQVEIYPLSIPLTEPFITSLGPDTHAQNVVVVIRTNDGISGFGECSPYMPISGESMETAFITGQYLAKLLIGQDPLLIASHHAAFDRLIYANNSIKSAFDIALYDIAAQQAGVPLYVLLGGKKDKTLITDYTISLDETNKMVSDAEKIVSNGFTVIKVKLGETKEKDVQRMRRIREAVGNNVPLRIDANQGWSVPEAIDTLQTLETCGIEHCEEPIKRWQFMDLPNVRKQSPIPLMADESCCDQHDAKRLLQLQACDYFNVKLGKSAGIFKALQIAGLAEAAGMKLQVGGFIESRIGFTASAHFALASPAVAYCDFDTPLMFTEDPVAGGITYSKGGVVTVPDVPGLGARLEDNYLKRLRKAEIK